MVLDLEVASEATLLEFSVHVELVTAVASSLSRSNEAVDVELGRSWIT